MTLQSFEFEKGVTYLLPSPSGLPPTHTERDEKDPSSNDAKELLAHRRSLSDSKLAALCTEVWPVLAVIGGVDSGLRAGGLCLHKSSGRRAILLGVLKEGSALAKLQWEEADLSVRYYTKGYSYVHVIQHLHNFLKLISLTSIKQFLCFSCLGPLSMYIILIPFC